jgi:hypothetical protein
MELALLKLLLPILVKYLIDSGAMSEIEGAAIQNLGDLIVWVKGLKTYPEFPPQDSKGQR